jgi:hypothetical protein
LDIGSTSNRVKKIWTVDLDSSGVFTLGGTVGVGGLNLNGQNITQVGNLSVLNTVSMGNNIILNNHYLSGDGGNEGVYVDSSGNVGIGTTGPDRKLDILDATNPQLRLSYADNTIYGDMRIDSNGDFVFSSTGGDALFGDGLAGDSVIDLYATTTRTWTFGLDDSDGDKFKISTSSDFSSGNILTVASNSVATVSYILMLEPQGTAPATCSIGQLYVDSSGAYCACSILNTWENLSASGTCE